MADTKSNRGVSGPMWMSNGDFVWMVEVLKPRALQTVKK